MKRLCVSSSYFGQEIAYWIAGFFMMSILLQEDRRTFLGKDFHAPRLMGDMPYLLLAKRVKVVMTFSWSMTQRFV